MYVDETKKPYADGGAESVGSAQKERSKGRLNVGANLEGTTKIKPIPIDQGKVLTTKIESPTGCPTGTPTNPKELKQGIQTCLGKQF